MPTAWKTEIVKNFGKHSPQYDQYCDVQNKVAQELISYLPSNHPSSVLEIGCGTGALTKHLIAKYKDTSFRITDISPEMIAISKQYIDHQNVEFSVMDGEDIRTLQKYDLIISSMAFQWFENLDVSLEKLKSVLNPGGQILYSMPGPHSFKEWRDILSTLDLPIGVLDFPVRPEVFAEEERIQHYKNAYDFLKNLKNIGAHHPKKDYQMLTSQQLKSACSAFDEKYAGVISWHILYGQITV